MFDVIRLRFLIVTLLSQEILTMYLNFNNFLLSTLYVLELRTVFRVYILILILDTDTRYFYVHTHSYFTYT